MSLSDFRLIKMIEMRCGYCHKKIAIELNHDNHLVCPHCKFYYGNVKVTITGEPGEVELFIDTKEPND